MSEPEVHPVQVHFNSQRSQVSTKVTLRAYAVYSHIWGPQQALIEGDCRGGFGAGELIAYLYAASFPKEEWRARFDEACAGMKGLS